MAHVGKFGPYAFRRDLTVLSDYPNLWLQRYIWAVDSIIAGNPVNSSRWGKVSRPAVMLPNGKAISWTWDFHGILLVDYRFTITMQIAAHDGSFDIIVDYDDDLFNTATTTFLQAQGNMTTGVFSIGWTWDTSTPPPPFTNVGFGNVRWAFPGGNDVLSIVPKSW